MRSTYLRLLHDPNWIKRREGEATIQLYAPLFQMCLPPPPLLGATVVSGRQIQIISKLFCPPPLYTQQIIESLMYPIIQSKISKKTLNKEVFIGQKNKKKRKNVLQIKECKSDHSIQDLKRNLNREDREEEWNNSNTFRATLKGSLNYVIIFIQWKRNRDTMRLKTFSKILSK